MGFKYWSPIDSSSGRTTDFLLLVLGRSEGVLRMLLDSCHSKVSSPVTDCVTSRHSFGKSPNEDLLLLLSLSS